MSREATQPVRLYATVRFGIGESATEVDVDTSTGMQLTVAASEMLLVQLDGERK